MMSPLLLPVDYHLTVDGKSAPVYVPGNIANYEPGRSSIFERERQLVSRHV